MDIDPCKSSSGKPKKRWATPQAAEFVARENERMGRRAIYWYECDACGRWHTTHVSGKRARKRARYKRNVAARAARPEQKETTENPQIPILCGTVT